MVNGQELREIAATILTILDMQRIGSLELARLHGRAISFPNEDLLGVDLPLISNEKCSIPQADLEFFYNRPDWGAIIHSATYKRHMETAFFLKTSAIVFGYDGFTLYPDGRTTYLQEVPGADFETIKKELERLTDKRYYISE